MPCHEHHQCIDKHFLCFHSLHVSIYYSLLFHMDRKGMKKTSLLFRSQTCISTFTIFVRRFLRKTKLGKQKIYNLHKEGWCREKIQTLAAGEVFTFTFTHINEICHVYFSLRLSILRKGSQYVNESSRFECVMWWEPLALANRFIKSLIKIPGSDDNIKRF